MGASNCKTIWRDKAQNDPNDKIGDFKVLRGLCDEVSYDSRMAKYIPDNGEYVYVSGGLGCTFNSAAPPAEMTCNSGCDYNGGCAIAGHFGKYQRVKYSADHYQCCSMGSATVGNKTCDPKFEDATAASCKDHLLKFCSIDDNIFKNKRCQTWCDVNKQACNDIKKKLCSTVDLESPNGAPHGPCTAWAMEDADGTGMADKFMLRFCEEHPTNKMCSCINSDFTKTKYNPLCTDLDCIHGGYATKPLIVARGAGCEMVDCSVYFDLKKIKSNVAISDLTIAQRCGDNDPHPRNTPQIPYSPMQLGLIVTIIIVIIIMVFRT